MCGRAAQTLDSWLWRAKNTQNTIVNLNETINGLQNQISNLTEMVMLLRKEKFGSSSEKTHHEVEGQISLFNEAEVEADFSTTEPITKDVCGYKRTNAKTKREELIKDLPVREVLCETLDGDCAADFLRDFNGYKHLHIF